CLFSKFITRAPLKVTIESVNPSCSAIGKAEAVCLPVAITTLCPALRTSAITSSVTLETRPSSFNNVPSRSIAISFLLLIKFPPVFSIARVLQGHIDFEHHHLSSNHPTYISLQF